MYSVQDCLNSETNHKEVTKPIMEKYNPICQLACYGSRILKTTSQFKVWWSCKRDGCDFIGTCIVEGDVRVALNVAVAASLVLLTPS